MLFLLMPDTIKYSYTFHWKLYLYVMYKYLLFSMSEKNKEIKVLSEKEHVRKRSHVYVESVIKTEEKVPIIKDNMVFIESREISIGMYKILNEIIDNSLDEAKRLKGKMESIKI